LQNPQHNKKKKAELAPWPLRVLSDYLQNPPPQKPIFGGPNPTRGEGLPFRGSRIEKIYDPRAIIGASPPGKLETAWRQWERWFFQHTDKY